MKRKIFIGSSSEGLTIAEGIKKGINDGLGDWIECEIWNEGKVFVANEGTLESLVKASRKYDYGILIASKDDVLFKRLKLFSVMRDNVLFEIGLFLGSLGLQRAFLFTHDKITLPSDYNGISVIKYGKKNLQEKINEIIDEISKTKNSFNLKPIPSAALAMGYFENFVKRFAKKKLYDNHLLKIIIPNNLSDISAQIEKYKQENPSISSDTERPVAFKYDNNQTHFWDIPTTLTTLSQLIDFFIHSKEVGINGEKEEWLQHEINNFKGTLEVLIEQSPITKNKVEVMYL